MSAIIHPDDDMFCGNLDHYEKCGKQFAEIIKNTVIQQKSKSGKILELPCGYGRVTRHLVQSLPPTQIVVADAMPEAVRFCAAQYGVSGIVVNEPLNEFGDIPDGAFRIAAMGSLITHLDEPSARDVLFHFFEKLSEDGIAIITTHGIRAREMLFSDNNWFELLPHDRDALKNAAKQEKYGYAKYAPNHSFEKKTVDIVGDSYGISLIPHKWMLNEINNLDLKLKEHRIGGWDNHQDVYIIGK